jgi:hypothetical protein
MRELYAVLNVYISCQLHRKCHGITVNSWFRNLGRSLMLNRGEQNGEGHHCIQRLWPIKEMFSFRLLCIISSRELRGISNFPHKSFGFATKTTKTAKRDVLRGPRLKSCSGDRPFWLRSSQSNAGMLPQIRIQPGPSTSFPIRYYL